MSSFAAVAARSCASHEGLALALAEALGCDTAGAPEALRELAAGLPREAAPDAAIAAIAELCGDLRVRRDGALLLPEVLRRGGGHPAGVAVAAAAAGQQAGYAVGLVGGGRRLLVAHHVSDDSMVVDPAAGLVGPHLRGRAQLALRARERRRDPGARDERAERHGDLALATAARALALQLPLADASRAVAEASHRRLLSRLN